MNAIDLHGKVAVVTGGAQGLGYAITQRLVSSGAIVSIWDRDNDILSRAVSSFSDGVSGVKVDVTDVAGLEEALTRVESELGIVSILVNSAGITGSNKSLEAYSQRDWQRVIEVNLNGTFYTNKLVVPGMKSQNYGRIVNISSVAGKEGNPNLSAYSAAKAGVIGLTKSLGKELAEFNIAVNTITPATAQTKMLESFTDEFIEYMRSKIPRGRFLDVEEAAAMVAWLASEENSFTTASTFDLSGGRTTY